MRAQKKYEFNPDYAVAPGVTIKETMEEMNIPAKEFASRLGISENSLHRIFRGEQPITCDTANKLEMVTGMPARFWNNSEATYREQLAKIREREILKSQLEWLKQIPVNELISRGLVKKFEDMVEQLKAVLTFFGVCDVPAWYREWCTAEVLARRSSCFQTNPGVAATWIRIGELAAYEIECASFNRQVFRENLEKIRNLTVSDPNEFCNPMRDLCAQAGVALVFVPEIGGAPWNGATKWLSKDKVMIILSLRGKSEDRFWFSFFHEAGHIVHGHSKKELLINIDDDQSDERELQADRFAATFLIPKAYEDRLRMCSSADAIIQLAQELHIAPGIVAGQYQYTMNRWSAHNQLIRRFEWEKPN